MWSWRVIIRTILWCHSYTGTILYQLHEILSTMNFCLWQSHNIDVIFCILSCKKYIFFVQQVIKFSTVDLIKWNPCLQLLMHFYLVENINSSKQIQSFYIGPITQHSMCLATTCLAISKAWYLCAVKCTVY